MSTEIVLSEIVISKIVISEIVLSEIVISEQREEDLHGVLGEHGVVELEHAKGEEVERRARRRLVVPHEVAKDARYAKQPRERERVAVAPADDV